MFKSPSAPEFRRKADARARRSGHLTAEALIVIPMLLVISIGVVEIGMVVSLKQSAMHAAIRGARVAAQGASTAQINQVVEQALSGFDVSLTEHAAYRLEDPEQGIDATQGDNSITCDKPATPLSNGNIRFTICVNSTGSPVSGLIAKFGAADLMDKILSNSAVALRECPVP